MALAIVVWFIAGMTLLVGGIVALGRGDTGTAQLQLARAKVVAAGDGAIQLAMAEHESRVAGEGSDAPIFETVQRLGELDVTVRLYPAEGFIDLNTATVNVLSVLFHVAGGLPPEQADAVADNVVKWRESARSDTASDSGNPQRFYSMEDMLRVDGVTRTLLDGVRDYTVAGSWAPGGIDWGASPQELLPLLDSLDPGQAEAQRDRNGPPAGSAGNRRGGSGVYRADALISYGGRTWLRRRWVRVGSARDSALPWRVVRTEAPRVVKG